MNEDAAQVKNSQKQHSNISFEYVYRDASNYKDRGRVVFQGDTMSIRQANKRLASAFSDEYYFIAEQIAIPEVFLWSQYSVSDDDHCWHEFECLERTTAQATDGRTLTQFVEAVEKAAKQGWREFELCDRENAEELRVQEVLCDLFRQRLAKVCAIGPLREDAERTSKG